ncbi:AAA family ATPase [Nocardioides sp. HB32]
MPPAGVLLLSGPPCSGKSSIGRLLVADRVHLEVDALFDVLLPGSGRGREDRMLAYDAAHVLARLALDRGRDVLLECTYARREQRASLVAAAPDTPLWVVEIHVPPDEAVRRFRGRRQETDLDEASVRERAAAFPYSDQAFRLTSAAAAPADHARAVAAWLRGGPPPVRPDSWAAAGRPWNGP